MKNREIWNIVLRLVALLLLWLGLILVFPIERGYANLRQALLSQEHGSYKEAAQFYQRASRALFWRREELLEKAGEQALLAQEPQLALDILYPLSRKNLLTSPGKYLLAQAYIQAEHKDNAVVLLEELARQEYRPLDVYSDLLPIYLSWQAYGQAEIVLEALVSLAPNNAEWQYQLGILRTALYPETALPELHRAVQLNEDYRNQVSVLEEQLILGQKENIPAVVYLYAGRGLASIGEWGLAEQAFRRSVELRPDYSEAWAYLGLAKGQQFKSRSASIHQEQMPTLSPLDKETQRYLVEHSGLQEIQQALRLDPHSQAGLAFLTLYWQQRGYPELALKSAQQAAKLYPQDLNAQVQYAQILVLVGDLKTAWQVILDARLHATDLVSARKALISFCVQNQIQLAETALPEARLLVYQNPSDVESMDLLAQVLFGLGYSQRARQWLERAIKLDHTYAPAYLHLGMISLSEGLFSQALTELEQAVEYGGSSSVADQARRLMSTYAP